MAHAQPADCKWNVAWDDNEMTSYLTGNGVWANLGIGDKCVTIWQWSSEQEHQGNSRRALKWLKEAYGPITVVDPGRPSHEEMSSWTFWAKMADEGLISIIQDPNEVPIYEDGAWLPHDDGFALQS